MIPQRPAGVSTSATVIYPVLYSPDGSNVQANTIASIEKANAQMSANNSAIWQNGMKDWMENAQIYMSCKPPIQPPPPPQKPPMYETDVTYADTSGRVVPPPEGANGTYWAWVETVVR